MRDIQEWWLAYRRCPWGPRIDDLRHIQLMRVQTTAEFDVEQLRLDKTNSIAEQLKRDIAGVKHNEAINQEANAVMQAGWLANLKKKYDKD